MRTAVRQRLSTRLVLRAARARAGALRDDGAEHDARAPSRSTRRPRPHRRQGQSLQHQRDRLASGAVAAARRAGHAKRASRRTSRTAGRPRHALPAAEAAGDELRARRRARRRRQRRAQPRQPRQGARLPAARPPITVPDALREHLAGADEPDSFQQNHGDTHDPLPRRPTRRRRRAARAFAATAALAQGSTPTKPITFVVPFAAGSATDQLARALGAVDHAEQTKQAVVVDNKAGASGMIAAQAAARAAADGYTVLITTNTTHAANEHLYKKLPYDPVKDFAPVTGLGKGGQVLVVRADVAVQERRRLPRARRRRSRASSASAAAARRAASRASCSSSSPASTSCTCRTRATRNAVTDLLGGQIDMMITDTATGLPQIKGGKLRALGVSARSGSRSLPDVPTIDEAGVKGYDMGYWFAAYVPAKTPPAVVERLHELLVAGNEERGREGVLREHRHRRLDDREPDELAKFQAAEAQKWGRVIKAPASSPSDRPPHRRHLRAVPPLLRAAPLQQGQGPALRRRRRRAADGAPDVEKGATHVGVATDHVIESFRNDLWPGYKTGDGHRAGALRAVPSARGRARGDGRRRLADGRARGRRRARLGGAASPPTMRRVEKVCIWTPDKDLAQCVRGDRVVQVDRRAQDDPRRRGRAREVRRRARADPRLPRARRRRRRRLSRDRRHRRGRRGAAAQPPRRDRSVSARRARRAPRRSRSSSSSSRRCAPTRRCSSASRRCAGAARPPPLPPGPSASKRRACSSAA